MALLHIFQTEAKYTLSSVSRERAILKFAITKGMKFDVGVMPQNPGVRVVTPQIIP